MKQGRGATMTHDDKRHGTIDLFAAMNMATGEVLYDTKKRHTAIVLACASGRTNQDVAAELRVNQATVGKWRRRFVERRLEGLFDEPRPGARRTITDDLVKGVVIKTLEDKPVDATHC